MDGERVYAVIDVINTRHSVNSLDCDKADQEEVDVNTSGFFSNHSSGISKLMIEQFLTEVVGPDRDWENYDDDPFEPDEYNLVLQTEVPGVQRKIFEQVRTQSA